VRDASLMAFTQQRAYERAFGRSNAEINADQDTEFDEDDLEYMDESILDDGTELLFKHDITPTILTPPAASPSLSAAVNLQNSTPLTTSSSSSSVSQGWTRKKRRKLNRTARAMGSEVGGITSRDRLFIDAISKGLDRIAGIGAPSDQEARLARLEAKIDAEREERKQKQQVEDAWKAKVESLLTKIASKYT